MLALPLNPGTWPRCKSAGASACPTRMTLRTGGSHASVHPASNNASTSARSHHKQTVSSGLRTRTRSACATGKVLSSIEPGSLIARRRYLPRTSFGLGVGLDVPARRSEFRPANTPLWRRATLAFQRFPLLPRSLAAPALRGNPFCLLHLGPFEGVKATPNCLPVDAELLREVGQALA
jgi:hypothetical protein